MCPKFILTLLLLSISMRDTADQTQEAIVLRCAFDKGSAETAIAPSDLMPATDFSKLLKERFNLQINSSITLKVINAKEIEVGAKEHSYQDYLTFYHNKHHANKSFKLAQDFR